MSELGEKLIKGLNECLEYEQGKRHDLRTFTKVVYCKDCKYWYPNKNFMEDSIFYYCSNLGVDMNADDFCSKGEKKDE